MFLNYLFTILLVSYSLSAGEISIRVFTGEEVASHEKLIVVGRQDEFKKFFYLMWNGDASEELSTAFYSQEPLEPLQSLLMEIRLPDLLQVLHWIF